MGVFDKFLSILQLDRPEDDELYDEDDGGYYDEASSFDDDGFEEKPKRSRFFRRSDSESAELQESGSDDNVTSIRRSGRGRVNADMAVYLAKPTSYDDSRVITETLLEGRTVILNLEGMDLEVAQRIIDFISGATFAIHGNLQKVSNYIFLVTPNNVDISGDIQDLLGGSVEATSVRGKF